MHGEYKVPGGKLVVIDLDVAHGKVQNVELSGDFFLEPEETLDHMTAALEGVSADSDIATLTDRISAATTGAQLLGITAEGVAVAVRRAIEGPPA